MIGCVEYWFAEWLAFKVFPILFLLCVSLFVDLVRNYQKTRDALNAELRKPSADEWCMAVEDHFCVNRMDADIVRQRAEYHAARDREPK